MSILDKIETQGREALTAVEHGAAWLVGEAAQYRTALADMEASSPMVADALAAGVAFAQAHGVPVVAIENAGAAVLAAAKAFAGELTTGPGAGA